MDIKVDYKKPILNSYYSQNVYPLYNTRKLIKPLNIYNKRNVRYNIPLNQYESYLFIDLFIAKIN